MAEPFLSEIRMFSFTFPPRGWADCNGQLLPINQNQALFSLLGTQFGGNGQVNFALPDLRARVPIGAGSLHPLGEAGGAATHTLTSAELPGHTHAAYVSDARGTTASPNDAFLAAAANAYGDAGSGQAAMAGLGSTGGSQPHNNTQPFLVIRYCIALQGIFPSPN